MKKTMHSRILLILFSLMLVMMTIPPVSATVYTNEDFEDETAGNNPSSGWYTYTESGFEISDVTVNSSRSGSQGFHIYDDAAPTSYSLFTIDTTTYYDYFIFYINVSQANHGHLNVSFNDSSGQELGRLDISNDSFYFNNSDTAIYSTTYGNDLWYRITIDLNLTTDRIGIYIYNVTAGSAVGSGWGDMEDGAGSYTDFKTVKFWSGDTNAAWVCIDDLQLAYTYINPNQAINNSIIAAVSALMGVAMLLSIIAVAYTNNVTPESLIMLAVVTIIGVITMMILAGAT